MKQPKEAVIVINGVRLTFAQAMAVRVAVAGFLHDLADPEHMAGLGGIGPLYQARLSEVQEAIFLNLKPQTTPPEKAAAPPETESGTPWANLIPEGASKVEIENIIRAAQSAAVNAFERDCRHLVEGTITDAVRDVSKRLEKLNGHYTYDKFNVLPEKKE
jgi:hypothetical protein